ncbi:hypothetical protein AMTR_s00158p00050890 [Amborella trichopoda]|uniref:Uncharacterized protein n=1 Tax=Amborella trichopoda TaxID=13333 RepID=W1PTA8_AMBTC|nr:hypothetical protein AMTR_s00158p00050890 [Amborella trichopoda]
MPQDQEAFARSPIEERRAQLKDSKASFAHVKGEMYEWNALLASSIEASTSELVASLATINALALRHRGRRTKLIR